MSLFKWNSHYTFLYILLITIFFSALFSFANQSENNPKTQLINNRLFNWQIHSYDDLRQYTQLIKKKSKLFKFDIHYMKGDICNQAIDYSPNNTRKLENEGDSNTINNEEHSSNLYNFLSLSSLSNSIFNHDANKSTKATNDSSCFLLTHDTPQVTNTYFTIKGILDMIKDEKHVNYFKQNKTSIALCFKNSPKEQCDDKEFISMIDNFFNSANKLTKENDLKIEFILDGAKFQCAKDRWRPWVYTWIRGEDPDEAFISDNKDLSYDRYDVFNDDETFLLDDINLDLGKFKNRGRPVQLWEPSDQLPIEYYSSAFKTTNNDLGYAFVINIDPTMFMVYSAEVSNEATHKKLLNFEGIKGLQGTVKVISKFTVINNNDSKNEKDNNDIYYISVVQNRRYKYTLTNINSNSNNDNSENNDNINNTLTSDIIIMIYTVKVNPANGSTSEFELKKQIIFEDLDIPEITQLEYINKSKKTIINSFKRNSHIEEYDFYLLTNTSFMGIYRLEVKSDLNNINSDIEYNVIEKMRMNVDLTSNISNNIKDVERYDISYISSEIETYNNNDNTNIGDIKDNKDIKTSESQYKFLISSLNENIDNDSIELFILEIDIEKNTTTYVAIGNINYNKNFKNFALTSIRISLEYLPSSNLHKGLLIGKLIEKNNSNSNNSELQDFTLGFVITLNTHTKVFSYSAQYNFGKGNNTSISTSHINSENKINFIVVKDDGFCYNNHTYNIKSDYKTCDREEKRSSGILNYYQGYINDSTLSPKLKENNSIEYSVNSNVKFKDDDIEINYFGSVINPCYQGDVVFGTYDTGYNPEVKMFNLFDKESNKTVLSFFESHEGLIEINEDVALCGVSRFFNGVIVDSWELADLY